MKQRNTKILPKLLSPLKLKGLAYAAGYITFNINREMNSGFALANNLSRSLTEILEYLLNKVHLGLRSGAEEDEVISKEEVRKWGPSSTKFNRFPLLSINGFGYCLR